MIVKINGIDISNFIAYNGLKWQRNDVENPDTGRDMAGLMHRGRVATKIRLDITCRPLYTSELRTLLNLIYPEFVEVTYDDPMYGLSTKVMYSNNNPASFQQRFPDGKELWSGVSFPLVER